MAKAILDNCTIYRILDKIDVSTQRKLVINCLKNCKDEIRVQEELKQENYTRLLSLLQLKPFDMKQIAECLLSLYFFNSEIADNEREIANAEARESYLDGNITLEEMQTIIHDNMEKIEGELYPAEYDLQLLSLLAKDPDEISLKDVQYIKELKEKALEVRLNPPTCNYPD